MTLIDAATNTPWLIMPDALRVILDAIQREHLDPALATQIRADRAARPSALAMRRARPLDSADSVGMVGGVAVLPIVGPIVRRGDMFSEVSGLSSLQSIARDFQAALDSPQVEAILLAIDSPGGEVTGVSELASAIYAARDKKCIWAYIEGMGASAAYWLGSAAERVVLADTAAVGSIGVVLAVRDPSAAKQPNIEFVSSQSPRKRLGPTSEAGRQAHQDLVDHTAEVFVSAVATQRGVPEATVMTDFGQGGVMVGRRAVTAGLADAVSTFEQTLSDLAQAADVRRRGLIMMRRSASQEEPVKLRDMFAAMFSGAQDAGLVADEVEAISSEVVAAERDQEIAALRQKLAEVQARAQAVTETAQAAAVSAFVEGHIRAGRLFPAERSALTDLYTSAIAESPTLAAKVEALLAARPPHGLFGESLAATSTLAVLHADRDGATKDTAARTEELLKKTPEGRAVLAQQAKK